MDSLITLILFAAGISLLFNTLLKKINIETIIGYILTGAIVAFIFDLQGSKNNLLDTIAEFGIAFLMFTIGLEVSIEKLKSIKKEVFLYGGAQVIITSIVFYSISRHLFEIGINASIIISLGLALSSTAIVLKLLNESKTLHKTYGKNALGVLLFQDMAVIPILLLISIIASTQGGGEDILLTISLNAIIVMSIFFFGGKFLSTPFFNFIANSKSDEIFIASVLFIIIGSAQLAHVFGFSYSLGAFIAGLIIARTQYKHQIEADLIPFRDLLLGIFFVTVGMQLNLIFIPDHICPIVLILVAIIAIKALIVFGIMRFGYRKQTSLKTAIILAQVGEFSFVVFELAKINNLFVNETLGQILIVSIIFSMILTPFIFKKLSFISEWMVGKHEEEEKVEKKLKLKNHTVICGYGATGQLVVKHLHKLKIPYVVIERDISLVNRGRKREINMILGNSAKKKILEKVNIEEAKAIFVALSQEEKMMRIVRSIRVISPNVRIIAKASSLFQRDFLEDMGKVFIIDEIRDVADSTIKYLKGLK
ncbi:cation:proton antiporter [Candidatus Gracilibacteria bacterium]|nr:cation:proton antiporter [Candidatus Gracilibacteria bacterium]